MIIINSNCKGTRAQYKLTCCEAIYGESRANLTKTLTLGRPGPAIRATAAAASARDRHRPIFTRLSAAAPGATAGGERAADVARGAAAAAAVVQGGGGGHVEARRRRVAPARRDRVQRGRTASCQLRPDAWPAPIGSSLCRSRLRDDRNRFHSCPISTPSSSGKSDDAGCSSGRVKCDGPCERRSSSPTPIVERSFAHSRHDQLGLRMASGTISAQILN